LLAFKRQHRRPLMSALFASFAVVM